MLGWLHPAVVPTIRNNYFVPDLVWEATVLSRTGMVDPTTMCFVGRHRFYHWTGAWCVAPMLKRHVQFLAPALSMLCFLNVHEWSYGVVFRTIIHSRLGKHYIGIMDAAWGHRFL